MEREVEDWESMRAEARNEQLICACLHCMARRHAEVLIAAKHAALSMVTAGQGEETFLELIDEKLLAVRSRSGICGSTSAGRGWEEDADEAEVLSVLHKEAPPQAVPEAGAAAAASATADMPVDVPQARRGDKKLSIFEVKKEALEAKKSQEEAAETLQRFLRFRWVTKSEKTAAETPLPAYTRASKGLAELKALGQCKKIDCPDLKVETLHRKNPAFHDKSCAYSDCDKCGLTEEFSVSVDLAGGRGKFSFGGVKLKANTNWIRAVSLGGCAAQGGVTAKGTFLAKVGHVAVFSEAEALARIQEMRDSKARNKPKKVALEFRRVKHEMCPVEWSNEICNWREYCKMPRDSGESAAQAAEEKDDPTYGKITAGAYQEELVTISGPRWKFMQKMLVHSSKYFEHDWKCEIGTAMRNVTSHTCVPHAFHAACRVLPGAVPVHALVVVLHVTTY